MSIDLDDLFQVARSFRRALCESKDGFPDYLRSALACFPKHACGRASMLLSLHLIDKGFADVQCVFNGCRYGTRESHAWVEIGLTIIDITADQFSDRRTEPVIVTNDHSWHNQFYGFQRELATKHFRETHRDWRELYNIAYRQIRDALLHLDLVSGYASIDER